MQEVEFTYDYIIQIIAEKLHNKADNVTQRKYDDLPSEVKPNWIGVANLIQKYNIEDIDPSTIPPLSNDLGDRPTVTWTINNDTAIYFNETSVESIRSNIISFLKLNESQLAKKLSSNELILIFSYISQYCLKTLTFHKQIFYQDYSTEGLDNANFTLYPQTFLVYKVTDEKISNDIETTDLVISQNVNTVIEDLFEVIRSRIPSLIIKYSYSFNRVQT